MGTEVLFTGITESNLLPFEYHLEDTGSILSEDLASLELLASFDKLWSAGEANTQRLTRETREANTRRSTLNQIEFDKQIRKLWKKRHAIHKEANKPLSTPLLAEICEEILKTLLENNTVSSNTVQQLLLFYDPCNFNLRAQFKMRQIFCDEYEWFSHVHSEKQKMHKALAERSYPPSPGAPCDDGNHAPASMRMPMKLPSNDPASLGASIDDDPTHIENPGHEPSSSTEASPAHAPDIISSSKGACDDGNRIPPSKQMAMALPTNDPASGGASIDDDRNHIENLSDEPSSSMEAPPAHALDITSSSNGACDNGNLAPPSTQMPMALPSDEPVSVGASIDDPNNIDNPGDEPSSSTEASRAHVPDITSSSNGACDDGNPAPPSTQMPVALPSNDPAPVGGSSDDDPNGIGNPSDESSRSTEASPAHPPDIAPSSNGASPPVREDDSERRDPPVPRDIENQRDGNGDLEAIPNQVLLTFALQAFQILSNVKSNDNSLLSREAEILRYCAEALTVIGFFCGLGVILLRNHRNHRNQRAATNVMSRIGFYVTGLGFIATLCVPLGKFMFWILGFIGFLFSALYAYALWKGWIV